MNANTKVPFGDLLKYYKKQIEEFEHRPSLSEAGDYFNTAPTTIRKILIKMDAEGLIILRSGRVYLKGKDANSVPDQRGRYNQHSYDAKSRGGKTAAAILKQRAEDKGIEYSAFAHIPSASDEGVLRRIDRIVERAIENGTAYHPRPTYVYLNGGKVG